MRFSRIWNWEERRPLRPLRTRRGPQGGAADAGDSPISSEEASKAVILREPAMVQPQSPVCRCNSQPAPLEVGSLSRHLCGPHPPWHLWSSAAAGVFQSWLRLVRTPSRPLDVFRQGGWWGARNNRVYAALIHPLLHSVWGVRHGAQTQFSFVITLITVKWHELGWGGGL